jgi:hypothetical protein
LEKWPKVAGENFKKGFKSLDCRTEAIFKGFDRIWGRH